MKRDDETSPPQPPRAAVPDRPKTPAELVDDTDAILNALALAVADALRMHKRAGNPICVGRDGKLEWIQPEDIVVPGDE